MASIAKKTQGRRKVQLARMEKDSNRRVTFSKRRLGLFKKASELCTLCGAEALVIVFSPGRKAFSFGHPSVEELVERFSRLKFSSASSSSSSVASSSKAPEPSTEGQNGGIIENLNTEFMILTKRFELEKKRGEEIDEMKKGCWWDNEIEELNIQQLLWLKNSLNVLKENVTQHYNLLIMLEAANASQDPLMETNDPINEAFNGGGGNLFNQN